MLDQNMNDVIEDYQRKSIFSGFLPGISGMHGIPLWCYYTNRGQCISSFGVQDKDHAMMEFYPAHQAHERTSVMGFRTFMKIDGHYIEAFADPCRENKMTLGMNFLSIEEETELYHIRVEYTTLPSEPLAGLMRQVSVTNKTDRVISIELADGMAEVLPSGVTSSTMKEIGQTAKAWMRVLDHKTCLPKFKVCASMEDHAEISELRGIHFAMGAQGEELLPVIVDRSVLFTHDNTLRKAYGLEQTPLHSLIGQFQVDCGDVPCCFFTYEKKMQPKESFSIREIYGVTEDMQAYERIRDSFVYEEWFSLKKAESEKTVADITERVCTKTGHPIFDAYNSCDET